MPRENILTTNTINDIDDNTKYRMILTTGESRVVTGATLKQYIETGTATPYIEVVTIGDDKGLISTEQFSVGKPNSPKESIFGAGDSYPIGTELTTPDGTPNPGSAWHYDEANRIGETITGATDITSILASSESSSTGLYGGITAGKCILVRSKVPYSGAKIKIALKGVVEPLNVSNKYLESIAAGWLPAGFMSCNADGFLEQYGLNLLQNDNSSEHWYFGFNPLSLDVPWEEVTLNINGTNYTGYWGRFCIDSDITQDATIEQIKLHADAFEVNTNGIFQLKGYARKARTVNFVKTPNADANPGNQNIPIGVSITELGTDNKFNNNADDGFILKGDLPVGLDTSIPLVLYIDFIPANGGTGDVEIITETIIANGSFVYDGTAIGTVVKEVATVTGALNVSYRVPILIDLSSSVPGDRIFIYVHRDAAVTNTNDTYEDFITIEGDQLLGYYWK